MGIFSLFGKKNRPTAPQEAVKVTPVKSEADAAGVNSQAHQLAQRNIGRSTAMKIDAIESAMTRDMFRNSDVKKTATPETQDTPAQQPAAAELPDSIEWAEEPVQGNFQATIPMMDMSSEFMLGALISEEAIALSTSEMAPAIEEAAILFSNGQIEPVEELLKQTIAEDKLVTASRTPWWMLFDLYQVTNQNMAFDSLSIDYASQFETSPPAWSEALHLAPQGKESRHSGVTPTIAFTGKLDESVSKQIERIQKLAQKTRVFRLEFARVTEVQPAGCRLLLKALKNLQKTERDLILVGASEFADKIRSTIQIGRRDETESPWLLLLEILQLLNREKEFEEASMDYCVTFEVSPPSFEAPKNTKVSTAPIEAAPADAASDDRFMMPIVIEGEITQLINEMTEYAADRQTLVIDCARLGRVDFTAAGLLLNGLTPLTSAGKTIEFHEVNHLVTALLQVMGLHHIGHIASHKY